MGELSVAHPRAANADLDFGAVLRGVLIGGTIAGVVDIFAAALINHVSVGLVLQVIASGLVGKASFAGGAPAVALGFVLQVLMSLIIAAVYGAGAVRLPILIRRPVAFGALFGVGVFVVMNFVVVPLSAAAHPKHPPTAAAIGTNLAAMIVFGLIVAISQARMGLRAAR
jgi:hypothetical protein